MRNEVIRADRLAAPLRSLTWINTVILGFAVLYATEIVSSLIRGAFKLNLLLVGAALLPFPVWIAWRNSNVLNGLRQRFTIRSLLWVGGWCLFYTGLALPAVISGEDIGPEALLALSVAPVCAGLALRAALGVQQARRANIETLDRKLIELLNDLAGKEIRAPEGTLVPSHTALGWMWVVIALLTLVGIDFLPVNELGLPDGRLAIGLMSGAVVAFVQARVAFQPTPSNLLASDLRCPVLLLRSFADDEGLSTYQGGWAVSSVFDPSLESRLAIHFSRYGPFVAVGSPDATTPVIGAARFSRLDEQWQDDVVRWIDEASVIVVMAGLTDWADWELRQVIARGATGRLLLVFPPERRGIMRRLDPLLRRLEAQVAARRRRLRRLPVRKGQQPPTAHPMKFAASMTARLERVRMAFEGTPWHAGLCELGEPDSMRALVFNLSGQVSAIRGRSRNRNVYHLAVLIGHWLTLDNSQRRLLTDQFSGGR